MPATQYDSPVRLPGQWWPQELVAASKAAAKARGWNYTQWLQEAAREQLRREARKAARETA